MSGSASLYRNMVQSLEHLLTSTTCSPQLQLDLQSGVVAFFLTKAEFCLNGGSQLLATFSKSCWNNWRTRISPQHLLFKKFSSQGKLSGCSSIPIQCRGLGSWHSQLTVGSRHIPSVLRKPNFKIPHYCQKASRPRWVRKI